MIKITRYIQTYLIFSLPLVVASMLWNNSSNNNTFLNIIHELLSWNMMLWFLVLTSFLIILVVAPRARELTLRRLANIKERDEREQYITGKASRVTYISTLSLMIFIFFLSIFSVNIHRLPDKQDINGKHHALNISLGFSLLEKSDSKRSQEKTVLFDSKIFSLSKETIIMILIGWQLIMFNWVARKEQMKAWQ